MLGDAKLNSLDTRLEQFKLSNANSQHELQKLLKEYSQLLEDYKALRNTSESTSNGVRSASTTPVVEKPRNPYVLFLIDGNGYVFNDELVKEKEEGGMRAARMLNDAVEKFLRDSSQPGDPRIMVRIYADMTNLSKQLAKSKLIGLEKRSLMPFAAGFTRAIGHFDFVDAMDEEGTRFKIRETFKLAVEDASCSHILLATCHDTSYLAQLVPYHGLQNKITLVQGAGFDSEFYSAGLTFAQFPTLFRWSELTPAASSTTKSSSTRAASSAKIPTPARDSQKPLILDSDNWRHSSASADPYSYDSNGISVAVPECTSDTLPAVSEDIKKTKLCRYFQRGFCRWGNKCKFAHVPDNLAPKPQAPAPAISALDRKNVSTYLPATVPRGFVALNKDGHRIDTYIRPPTADEWITYNSRFHKQKPCNAHHLAGACTNFNCPYDHHPLEVESQHCLEYVLRCSPCPSKGGCRERDCFQGHICQKDGCVGQIKGCKLKVDAHTADPKLASMVPAVSGGEILVGREEAVGMDGGSWDGGW